MVWWVEDPQLIHIFFGCIPLACEIYNFLPSKITLLSLALKAFYEP